MKSREFDRICGKIAQCLFLGHGGWVHQRKHVWTFSFSRYFTEKSETWFLWTKRRRKCLNGGVFRVVLCLLGLLVQKESKNAKIKAYLRLCSGNTMKTRYCCFRKGSARKNFVKTLETIFLGILWKQTFNFDFHSKNFVKVLFTIPKKLFVTFSRVFSKENELTLPCRNLIFAFLYIIK